VQAVVLGPAGTVLTAARPTRSRSRSCSPSSGPSQGRGPERVLAAVAAGGAALAVWLLVGFVRALPGGIGAEHGFYRVKLAVTSPLGDHNTAAGLLLVGLVVGVLLRRGPSAAPGGDDARRGWRDVRWRTVAPGRSSWLGLVATLSRGAVAVLVVVAAAAWVVASDRRVAVGLSAATAAVVPGWRGHRDAGHLAAPAEHRGRRPLAEAGAGSARGLDPRAGGPRDPRAELGAPTPCWASGSAGSPSTPPTCRAPTTTPTRRSRTPSPRAGCCCCS
jgi:hypothetical protein